MAPFRRMSSIPETAASPHWKSVVLISICRTGAFRFAGLALSAHQNIQSQVRQRLIPLPASYLGAFRPHLPQRHCSPFVGWTRTIIESSEPKVTLSMAVCLTFSAFLSIVLVSIQIPLRKRFLLQKYPTGNCMLFQLFSKVTALQSPTHADEEP